MSQEAVFGSRWLIGTASMLVAQGPVILYTLGLFIKPLNLEFGWDRASISAAGGIAAISSAITIPFVGSMMDRWGVRTVLLPIVVFCASSVALIAHSKISHRLRDVLCDHWRFGLGPGAARVCKMRFCLV